MREIPQDLGATELATHIERYSEVWVKDQKVIGSVPVGIELDRPARRLVQAKLDRLTKGRRNGPAVVARDVYDLDLGRRVEGTSRNSSG